MVLVSRGAPRSAATPGCGVQRRWRRGSRYGEQAARLNGGSDADEEIRGALAGFGLAVASTAKLS